MSVKVGKGVLEPSYRKRTAYQAMLLGGMATLASAVLVLGDLETRDDIALRHLLLHYFVVGNLWTAFARLIRKLRTPAVHVIAVNRAIARMPLFVLVINRRAQFRKITRGGWFIE